LITRLFKSANQEIYAVADQVTVSVTTFLTGILLARVCLKADYALYYLAIAHLPFWDNIRQGLLTTPFTVFFPHKKEEEKADYSISTFILAAGFVGSAVLAVLIGSAVIFYILGDHALAKAFALTALLTAGFIFRGFFRGVFIARLQSGRALILDASISILQLSSIVILYRTGLLTVFRALLAIGLIQSLSLPFGLINFHNFKHIISLIKQIRTTLRQNWDLGKWLMGKSLAFALSIDSLPWIFRLLHNDMILLSSLAAGIAIVNIANPVWIGLNNIMGARLAHSYAGNGKTRLKSEVRKNQIVLFLIMSAVTSAIALFARPLLILFYGNKYADSGYIVSVLALVMLISVCTIILEQGLVTSGRSKPIFHLYLVVFLISIGPSLAFIHFWGLWGLLFSYILVWICISLLRVGTYKKHLGKNT
jgi:O-antigen/teichoic acid export membrane protein